MIEIRGLFQTYPGPQGPVEALRGIDLHIPPGEVFGIIGRSGAGKSSLVRTINLLNRPTAGAVIVNGRDLTKLSDAELRAARRDIGMVFQHFNLLHSRTVYDNAALPLELIGMSRSDIRARVQPLLELVGLTALADRYPAQIRGGQKQRVGIARALATSPELLLADESTSALDPETTQEVLGLLRRVNRELGITIVLITHEMDVVRAVADRVAVMDGGRVVETGTTAEVFAHPQAETTRRFVSSVMRTVPREDELAKLRSEHPGRLVLVDVADRNRIGTALSEAARDGVSFEIAFGGISILQSHTFGTLTLSLDGPEDAVSRAVEALRAVTTVQEVSE